MKSREVKRKEAEERKTYISSLNPKSRLDLLDSRLGKNVGARKERTKLNSLLNTIPNTPEVSNA